MESIPKDTISHVNDSIQADNLIKKCLLKNVDKLCNDKAKLAFWYEKNLQSCGKSLQKRSSILSKYASALFVQQSELSNAIIRLKRSRIKYRNDDKKLCLINININTCRDVLKGVKISLENIKSELESILKKVEYKKLAKGKDERTEFNIIMGVKKFCQKLAKNIFKR